MNGQLKLFCFTFSVSFTGSLPPGTLNVSLAGLAAAGNWHNAIAFGAGAVLVEVLLVRFALTAIPKICPFKKHTQLFRFFSIAVLLLFGFSAIVAAIQMKTLNTSIPLLSSWPFVAGLLLSFLNPLHLPFWLGWSAVFKAKKLLHEDSHFYNWFVAGIGTGTAWAFALYGAGGKALVHLLSEKQYLLNWAVGIALISVSVIEAVKLLRSRRTVAATANSLQ